jgi:hypothetical protein
MPDNSTCAESRLANDPNVALLLIVSKAPPDGSEHTRPTFRIVGLEELVERLAA